MICGSQRVLVYYEKYIAVVCYIMTYGNQRVRVYYERFIASVEHAAVCYRPIGSVVTKGCLYIMRDIHSLCRTRCCLLLLWNDNIGGAQPMICISINKDSLNTIHRPYVGSMLDRRRRRWTNIKPTLGQCIVLTVITANRNVQPKYSVLVLGRRRRSWANINTTLRQRLVFIGRESQQKWAINR